MTELSHLLVAIISRVTLITADVIVIVVTWIKTARQTREAALLGVGVGVSATLLRDGKYVVEPLESGTYSFVQEAFTLCESKNAVYRGVSR